MSKHPLSVSPLSQAFNSTTSRLLSAASFASSSPSPSSSPPSAPSSPSSTPGDSPERRYPWVSRVVPASLLPRIATLLDLSRIHAPIGSWLLFWPCAHSAALAAPASKLSPTYEQAASAYIRAREDGSTLQQLLRAAETPSQAALATASVAGGVAAAAEAAESAGSDAGVDAGLSVPVEGTAGTSGELHADTTGGDLSELANHIATLVPVEALWSDAAKWIGLCGVGAVLMRSAGCIINDLFDRKLDARVERTQSRPLASGRLSPQAALASLSVHLGLSLALLLLFNPPTVATALASVGLVAVYPLMKRVTHWPQFVLGLTFNWGALVGWTAVTGRRLFAESSLLSPSQGLSAAGVSGQLGAALPSTVFGLPSTLFPLELTPLLLYVSGIFWTLTYDTIYAHQDKVDDRRVGIKSTALLFGTRTPLWTAAFSSVYAAALLGAGLCSQSLWPYYLGVGLCYAQLLSQTRINMDDPKACSAAFRSNQWVGATLFLGILASKLLEVYRHRKSEKDTEAKSETPCASAA
ncbi:UNVERIFIED_CONTAM: 4-hydroxybenzoate polyprenyl transferase [Hammondia hammondi]|eukprot:XP_008883096.1 4-hydroxybenzoate polyprenyl transferase [Hammondia hammondi]